MTGAKPWASVRPAAEHAVVSLRKYVQKIPCLDGVELHRRRSRQQHALGLRADLPEKGHQLVRLGPFVDFIGASVHLWQFAAARAVCFVHNHAGVLAPQELVDCLRQSRERPNPCDTNPIRRGHFPSDFAPSDGYSKSFSSTQARPFQRADGSRSSSINSSCHC